MKREKTHVLLSILPNLACAQTFDRDLYFGIQNDSDVTKLQDFLTDQEVYSGPITGNFFSLTLSAVKKFQSAQSISPVSGYFGPLSRGKANHILAAEGISSTGVTDESGSIMPVTTPAPKTTNDVVSSLMAQILLLQQQLNALQQQQQSLQTIQQQQTVQTQTLQTIQQNTTPTPTPSATPTPTPTPLSPSTVLPTPTPTAVPTPTPTPTPWVEIPATLALLPSSSTFIQPPLTNPVVASLSCLYAGNTDWGHYVNPSSFVYEVISNDFTKSDLPLSIRYGNNPSCADIYLTTYPQKGGKFQLEITALKFGSNGVESDAIGLPITTVQYEIRDPNNIVLWDNNVLGQGAIYQSPSSQIVNPYNQQIYSAIVYVGGHSTATLQANWTGSNPYNNLAYSYVPCDLSNLPGSCSQEPDPTRTTSANGGSFPISFTSGYNYAKINILIPSTAINGTGGYVTPSDSILNATLILQ